jgi:septum formation topological specificity factor MinE
VHERRRKIQGRALLKRRKAAILAGKRESGAKGQGVDDLREDKLEIDTIVWFPELRTES